jgi:hypothetical protein
MQKYFSCFLILLFCDTLAYAQKVTVKKLGSSSLNESLYDVIKFSDSICNAVGENGARAKINYLQNSCVYSIDTNRRTVVELINAWGLSAYPFEIENDSNRSQYANYFFEGEQYTSCFDARILIPKAVVPHTTIYKRGKFKTDTLQKMYGSLVWQFFKQKKQLYALKYNLFGTTIYCVSNKFNKSKKIKGLLHKSFVLSDTSLLLCGATNFRLKHGIININGITTKFKGKGMIWDVAMVGDVIIGAGSKGKIFVRHPHQTKFQIIETGEPYHFYDLCIVDAQTAILVGQGGIVYKLDLMY